jgi:anti-anti-sigma factor
MPAGSGSIDRAMPLRYTETFVNPFETRGIKMQPNKMPHTMITWNERDATVQPAGNVVASLVPELRSALRGALADGVRQMTIDFSRVGMVDSTGLGLLISAHNSLSKVGGKLAVVNASKEILELFRAMRIHQHFSIGGPSDHALCGVREGK